MKIRMNLLLDSLVTFRTKNVIQVVIEICQILGIGIWIWYEIAPDRGGEPQDTQGIFHLPNGKMIYLGLFFIIDAALILNVALRRKPKDAWKVSFGSPSISSKNCRPTFADDVQAATLNFIELKNSLGIENPRTLTSQFHLMKTLTAGHHHDEAITLGRELVTSCVAVFGHADQATLTAQNYLYLCIIQKRHQCGNLIEISQIDIEAMRKILSHRASELPSNHREVLRAEELLALMLEPADLADSNSQVIFEESNRKKLIDLNHLEVADEKEVTSIKALMTFTLDCLLIVLASPFRALRVARPLMILRRMAVATEKEPNWKFPLLSRESFLVLQLGVLLIYSLGLVVLSIGDLIFQAEFITATAPSKQPFGTLSSSIWYSIQTVTLVGAQHDPITFAGRLYSVLLLFMGLGIIGLFGMLFQRIFGMSFLPKHVNHKRLLEDGTP